MNISNGKPLIKWLELSVSGAWKKGGATMTVHPVNVGRDRQCYALALGQRWVCGSDGALTFFDSVTAAGRFLELLNVDDYAQGDGCDGASLARDPCQCFQFGGKGLRTCDKCRIGDESRAQAIREFARWEECW